MLHIALVTEKGLICLSVPLPAEQPVYPDVSRIFPVANRMQRAAYDLLGIYAHEGQDHRKWLRHGAWHGGSFPLRKDFVTHTQTRLRASLSSPGGRGGKRPSTYGAWDKKQ